MGTQTMFDVLSAATSLLWSVSLFTSISLAAETSAPRWPQLPVSGVTQSVLLNHDLPGHGEAIFSDLPAKYSLQAFDPDPSICDSSVEQHAGFLDIDDDKHLFFWFFESRTTPDEAPLTLWLNGGPGGSSAIGLFFELGPCNIIDEDGNTTVNPFAWNTHSNMIFLDQPINVGYSYSNSSHVDNSPVAAEDVYAFLQLFFKKYPKYASAPFHVATESYGGTYGPHVAAEIHKRNKMISKHARADTRTINLASVILANGHTDPLVQIPSVVDYVCDGPYALLESEGPECTEWRQKVPTAKRLIQTCYDFDTPLTCAPGNYYWSEMNRPTRSLKRNPYDVRMPCEIASPFCYPQFAWVQTWLNKTSTKKAIGVPPSTNFRLSNYEVNSAFHARGDGARYSAALLPELVNDGIRLLVYAGMTDMACNYIGNEAWVTQLPNRFHEEFQNSSFKPWTTLRSGRKAGEVRYAGGEGATAGNLTFVKVYEAGHLVPLDQPEAALDLFTRWTFNMPLHK